MMVSLRRRVWLVLGVAAAWLAGSSPDAGSQARAADAPTWKAGAAKVVITPQTPMWMAGYGGRDHVAEGKETDLWAKALVLEDATGHRSALVTLDLVGIDQALTRAICARLEHEQKFARTDVAICTSHTHCGPVVGYNLRPMHFELVPDEQKKSILDYAKTLESQVVGLVAEAVKNLAPADVSWGSGKSTFATNRRTNREAEVPEVRAAGRLNGPVDHDVPVLSVRDKAGKIQAVVFGYACHATVMGFYQWFADYPGCAQTEVERLNPGAIALFWAGCGGDQNPLPRRTVELAQAYGKRLADAVQDVLTAPMRPVAPQLKTFYREIALPLDKLPTREELQATAESKDRFQAARAKMLLRQMDEGRPLSPTYPYPIGFWRIGEEVEFVILGGEVVVDYAVRLKAELHGTRTWVAGYSNDVMAYIPSRRVLTEGGYEGGGSMVYYGLPTMWGPDVESVLIGAVHELSGAGK